MANTGDWCVRMMIDTVDDVVSESMDVIIILLAHLCTKYLTRNVNKNNGCQCTPCVMGIQWAWQKEPQ